MKKTLLLLSILFLVINSFAQNATLKGKVIDGTNNEPIPFANIIIKGTPIGTSSDLEGNFIFTNLPAGFVTIQASYVGYKKNQGQDIFLVNNNIPYIEIKLQPSENLLSEVVIRVDPFKKNTEAPLSMLSIRTKEIESNPGSNRDISRVIQSFPGVGSTPAFRNDIIIRGGGPSENRFFLDDVEIPVLNHFSTQGASGGPVGIINADFIQSVDYYSGSFPANKYNALSGLFDFKLKEGSKDKTNFQFTLGASETALTIDGPIGKKTTYIFSVRRSYLQFLFSAIGLPFLPTYTDYQFKLKTNIDKKNQLSVISLGSLDHFALNEGIENPDESQQSILSQIPVNNQWSYTFGVVYKHFFANGQHMLVLSRNMLNNEFYKYPENDESQAKSLDYNSTEQENKLRYELTWNQSNIKFLISANLESASYYNSTKQQLYLQDSLINFNYETNLNIFKYGVSAQASKKILDNRLLISLGVRMDANNYNKKTASLLQHFSPRTSLSYALSEKTLLNAGIGRYFQLPAYTTLGYRNSDGSLANENTADYIGVQHYNLGIEHRFSEQSLFSIEGFYKDYFQYPIDLISGSSLANQGADYSSVAGATAATFTGFGEAFGFELMNRLNYNKFSLLASYTFVRSRFSNLANELIPSSWDSKHLLTITGSKELKRNWRFGFKWRFVGGLPYTPYDIETSSNIQAWNAIGQAYLDYSLLNAERNPAFHQLDLRIDKNYYFNKWALMLYLDIQNAYNFQYINQDFIVRAKNPDGSFQTINQGENYVLKSLPSESGTVLPTIGIMIKF